VLHGNALRVRAGSGGIAHIPARGTIATFSTTETPGPGAGTDAGNHVRQISDVDDVRRHVPLRSPPATIRPSRDQTGVGAETQPRCRRRLFPEIAVDTRARRASIERIASALDLPVRDALQPEVVNGKRNAEHRSATES